MALHNVKCPFCDLSDRVNGEVNANQLMREHLKERHKQAYENWQALYESIRSERAYLNSLQEKSLKEYGIRIY